MDRPLLVGGCKRICVCYAWAGMIRQERFYLWKHAFISARIKSLCQYIIVLFFKFNWMTKKIDKNWRMLVCCGGLAIKIAVAKFSWIYYPDTYCYVTRISSFQHIVVLSFSRLGMLWFLKSLFSPSVKPMNIIRLRKKVLLQNLEYLQSLQPQAAIFPVLKSNAYGHGLKQITKMLSRTDVPYLVVDSYPEYVVVKKYSKIPILILGETLLENYRKFDHKHTVFCVYNVWTIRYLWRLGKETKIHLFFNTGMNREGIQEDELPGLIKELQSHPNLAVEGVLSHFFDADTLSEQTIADQIQCFKRMYYKVIDAWYSPARRHIGNSAAIFKVNDEFFNAYRPGIALYGYNPLQLQDPVYKHGNNVLPILSITSRVISLQTIRPGEWVSYHHEYRPSDKETIATVPFGYAEWLSRNASGKIFIKHRKTFFRQVWTICMNLSTYVVDSSVHIGDEVEIISDNPRAKNSLANLAEQSGTIVYETLVKLDRGIRRETI